MTYINIFAGKLQIPLKDGQEQAQETNPVKTISEWKKDTTEHPIQLIQPKIKEVCTNCGSSLRLKEFNGRKLCEGCRYVEEKLEKKKLAEQFTQEEMLSAGYSEEEIKKIKAGDFNGINTN